ncbi:M48 family metallopeptidase [Lipingzhangella sp. LS1_29]|uniref:M48 family metallopeptidase n=1 Tax=Lipingzhangella rawalii TaxID=2055835 RepID=A0ABU2HB94_9ACTN|nr:M48 family metallopeptidase [Lipingzhangella rawalii]MDS1272551.1 M48 family metallopeptidase [Lipingzhangella rawalii]
MPATPEVEVRRSSRRRRTVSAYREQDKTVVLVPAKFTPEQEERWVQHMVRRLAKREQRRSPSEPELYQRAAELARRYLDGAVRPHSVRWVDNQRTRWGSCTPADGTIRVSRRLVGMPSWVLDYVLVHELAHLLVPGHGADFWELVQRYPRTERARGYLEGVAAAPRLHSSWGTRLDAAGTATDTTHASANGHDPPGDR